MEIVNAQGERELFEEAKLRRSLEAAGAESHMVDEVIERVEHKIAEGASTADIYEHAREVLKTTKRPVAARYSLRRAVAELGPTGFPFEQFVAEIFRTKGYAVKTGQTLTGKCIQHEVDVIAENEKELVIMEAKFHQNFSFKTDIKAALYVHARFEDLEASRVGGLQKKGQSIAYFLLTNTKFTSHALQYGECAGVPLVGWDYPAADNLRAMIEETGLHPVTALSTLSQNNKKALFEQNVVLCRDIQEHPDILEGLDLSAEMRSDALEEARLLCLPRT